MEQMIIFMGLFFGAVAVLKLADWEGFVETYQQYDIISKRVPGYAWMYPWIEVALSVAYLTGWQLKVTAAVTLVLMVVGVVGVYNALRHGSHELKCACLGTFIHRWVEIPLTRLTLFEDVVMGGMALVILLG